MIASHNKSESVHHVNLLFLSLSLSWQNLFAQKWDIEPETPKEEEVFSNSIMIHDS
jgi:hypothetical protein